jgi:hypothetical protein
MELAAYFNIKVEAFGFYFIRFVVLLVGAEPCILLRRMHRGLRNYLFFFFYFRELLYLVNAGWTCFAITALEIFLYLSKLN